MGYFIRSTLLIIALLTSACGWYLRGGQNQSAPFDLHLVSTNPYSPMTLAFKKSMQQRAINDNTNAPLQLYIGNETLTKRTVAVTNIGSPSQYELRLNVDFRYSFAKENESILVAKSSSVYRVFDFDPSNTVAKSEEENTLLAEMRRELAHRILQQAPEQ